MAGQLTRQSDCLFSQRTLLPRATFGFNFVNSPLNASITGRLIVAVLSVRAITLKCTSNKPLGPSIKG